MNCYQITRSHISSSVVSFSPYVYYCVINYESDVFSDVNCSILECFVFTIVILEWNLQEMN